jgi:hypothetical protein
MSTCRLQIVQVGNGSNVPRNGLQTARSDKQNERDERSPGIGDLSGQVRIEFLAKGHAGGNPRQTRLTAH